MTYSNENKRFTLGQVTYVGKEADVMYDLAAYGTTTNLEIAHRRAADGGDYTQAVTNLEDMGVIVREQAPRVTARRRGQEVYVLRLKEDQQMSWRAHVITTTKDFAGTPQEASLHKKLSRLNEQRLAELEDHRLAEAVIQDKWFKAMNVAEYEAKMLFLMDQGE